MPRLRINLRDLAQIDELDLTAEVDELETRQTHEDRAREEREARERRPINPIALQRRQENRKFGKDISRMLRDRERTKP
jgi:hypothetical protein